MTLVGAQLGFAQTQLIVASAPGGRTDIATRAIAEEISRATGETVAVQNRPCGAQMAAMDLARLNAAPRDGRTLFIFFIFAGGTGNTAGELASGMQQLMPVALIGSFATRGWIGVFAPAGAHPAVVARAESAMVAALRTPTVRDRAALINFVPGGGTTRLALAMGAAPGAASPMRAESQFTQTNSRKTVGRSGFYSFDVARVAPRAALD